MVWMWLFIIPVNNKKRFKIIEMKDGDLKTIWDENDEYAILKSDNTIIFNVHLKMINFERIRKVNSDKTISDFKLSLECKLKINNIINFQFYPILLDSVSFSFPFTRVPNEDRFGFKRCKSVTVISRAYNFQYREQKWVDLSMKWD